MWPHAGQSLARMKGTEMANPVFSRLEKEWTTTPAGYPTMPGYQPMNGDAAAPGAAPTAPSAYDPCSPYGQGVLSHPSYDQRAYKGLEQAYQSPVADAVDRGRMTYDDVLVKTGICFVILLAAAAISWMMCFYYPLWALAFMSIGVIAAFVLVLVNSFSQKVRPWAVIAYAAAEGMALGTVSLFMELKYPGIVLQAVIATLMVFGLMLILFSSGKVRNSPRLLLITVVGMIGLLVSRLLVGILQGLGLAGNLGQATFMGIPLGVVVGLIAVVLAAMCLIQDFDAIKVGVEQGVPSVYAWRCAFGMMVTVVWMYTEILRIISMILNAERATE